MSNLMEFLSGKTDDQEILQLETDGKAKKPNL